MGFLHGSLLTVAHVVVDRIELRLVGGLSRAGGGQRRAARVAVEVGLRLLRCVVDVVVSL